MAERLPGTRTWTISERPRGRGRGRRRTHATDDNDRAGDVKRRVVRVEANTGRTGGVGRNGGERGAVEEEGHELLNGGEVEVDHCDTRTMSR